MSEGAKQSDTSAVVEIGSTQASRASTDDEKQRFEVELEFVQCLANPTYLNFLAQNDYLDSDDFLAYLKYLEYWRKPEYARFIIFPHALYFLRLLQQPPFREALKRADYSLMLHQQQGFHWQFAKSMKPLSEAVNGVKNADGNTAQQNGVGASDPAAPIADVIMKPLPSSKVDANTATK